MCEALKGKGLKESLKKEGPWRSPPLLPNPDFTHLSVWVLYQMAA